MNQCSLSAAWTTVDIRTSRDVLKKSVSHLIILKIGHGYGVVDI